MINECSASSSGKRNSTASALDGVNTNGAIAKSTSCKQGDFVYFESENCEHCFKHPGKNPGNSVSCIKAHHNQILIDLVNIV